MKLLHRHEATPGPLAEGPDATRALVHGLVLALLDELNVTGAPTPARADQCAAAFTLLEWTGVELDEFAPPAAPVSVVQMLGHLGEVAAATGDPMLAYAVDWMQAAEPRPS